MGVNVTAAPPNVAVTPALVRKPDAETKTVVPDGPEEGDMAMVTGVTVNVAEAVLPFASLTITLYAPGDLLAGTRKVLVVIAPVTVVPPPPTQAVVIPPKVSVSTPAARFGVNPVPVTVTDFPQGPDVGDRVMVVAAYAVGVNNVSGSVATNIIVKMSVAKLFVFGNVFFISIFFTFFFFFLLLSFRQPYPACVVGSRPRGSRPRGFSSVLSRWWRRSWCVPPPPPSARFLC